MHWNDAVVGVGSSLLVSLATQHHWPREAKAIMAAMFALGAAALGLAWAGVHITRDTIGPAFVASWAAQQGIWQLGEIIPGWNHLQEHLLSAGSVADSPAAPVEPFSTEIPDDAELDQ